MTNQNKILVAMTLLFIAIVLLLLTGCGEKLPQPNHFVVRQSCFVPADHPFSGEDDKVLFLGPGTHVIIVGREWVYENVEGDGRD